MIGSEPLAEVMMKSSDERLLCTSRDDVDRQSCIRDALHEFLHTLEDRSLRHCMEDVALHSIHLFGFLIRDVDAFLFLDEHLYGVEATRTLCGIGVVSCHVDTELCHGLLPGDSMMRHGVVEHAVHIEKHGLGVELYPKGRVIRVDGLFDIHH